MAWRALLTRIGRTLVVWSTMQVWPLVRVVPVWPNLRLFSVVLLYHLARHVQIRLCLLGVECPLKSSEGRLETCPVFSFLPGADMK